jgi:uncharacterized protein YxeA
MKSLSKRFFYKSKILLQKIIEVILIKKVLLHVKGSFTENYRRNLGQKGSFTRQTSKVLLQKIIEEILINKNLLHVKGPFTENYRRHLDQKSSFTENYRRNLDKKGSFICQRFFYRKLSKKSWSKRFFYTSNVKGSFTENYRRNFDQKGSFTRQMSKVLLQKIIEEILIKKVLLHLKGSFTENYRRNLDQKGPFTRQRFFYRKLSKKS